MKYTAITLALVGTQAASLKDKLAANTLAQVETEAQVECPGGGASYSSWGGSHGGCGGCGGCLGGFGGFSGLGFRGCGACGGLGCGACGWGRGFSGCGCGGAGCGACGFNGLGLGYGYGLGGYGGLYGGCGGLYGGYGSGLGLYGGCGACGGAGCGACYGRGYGCGCGGYGCGGCGYGNYGGSSAYIPRNTFGCYNGALNYNRGFNQNCATCIGDTICKGPRQRMFCDDSDNITNVCEEINAPETTIIRENNRKFGGNFNECVYKENTCAPTTCVDKLDAIPIGNSCATIIDAGCC